MPKGHPVKSIHEEWQERQRTIDINLAHVPVQMKAAMINMLKHEFYAGAGSTVVIYAEEMSACSQDLAKQDIAFRETSESLMNELEAHVQKFTAGVH